MVITMTNTTTCPAVTPADIASIRVRETSAAGLVIIIGSLLRSEGRDVAPAPRDVCRLVIDGRVV